MMLKNDLKMHFSRYTKKRLRAHALPQINIPTSTVKWHSQNQKWNLVYWLELMSKMFILLHTQGYREKEIPEGFRFGKFAIDFWAHF